LVGAAQARNATQSRWNNHPHFCQSQSRAETDLSCRRSFPHHDFVMPFGTEIFLKIFRAMLRCAKRM